MPIAASGGSRVRAAPTAVLLVVVLSLAIGPVRANAGETETFRLQPHPLEVQGQERRTFTFDVPVGGSVSDAVHLTNKTGETRRFRVYGADASRDPETGTVIVEPAGAPKEGIGSWITVEHEDVPLLASSSETIRFRVDRPRDQHASGIGAIVAEEIQEDPAGAGIEVVFRLAITVELTGDATGISVVTPTLDLPIALVPSEGMARTVVSNDTLEPVETQVSFEVESLTGRIWQLDPVRVRLQPGESTRVSSDWTTVPRWGGAFVASASATWEAGTVSSTSSRTVHPPLWLLAIAIALVGMRGVREMWSRRKERRSWPEHPASPAPDPDALRGRLIDAALWLHAAGRGSPVELRETTIAECRAIAARAGHTEGAEDVERAARSLEAFARGVESDDGSARRAARDFDAWIREHRDDPRADQLVGS